MLTRLMQRAVALKSELCWHGRCWKFWIPGRAVALWRLTSPCPATAAQLSATLLPKPAGRPPWPEPHVTGHPKSHGPCQEQRAGAKHPVIGQHKASRAGGPANIPLPVQCLQPRGTATFLP